ncbi:MAG: LCP family protein, partial [Acidimicrobiales bacterium]
PVAPGPVGPGPVAPGPVAPGRAKAHSARRRPLRRWPRRILVGANVIVALVLVGAASAYGYVQWRLGQIKHISVAGLATAGNSSQSQSDGSSVPPFTLLLIGSDTRNLANGSQFGGANASPGQRSDSILLVRVVPRTRSLALLSVPRDTVVAVPGYGNTRINTAFDTGNPNLLIQVLSQDFGIQVNHVASFNFDTFESIANAIGGVYQWFPTGAKDTFSDLGQQPGCQLLTGDQALAFTRSRDYEYFLDGSWHYQISPESDLARIERQQAFTKAAVKKAEQVAPTNPIALNNLVTGLTKNITLDTDFSNSLILSLAEDFHSAPLAGIPSYTYPTTNIPDSGEVAPDLSAGQAMIDQWLNVAPLPPAAPAPSPTTPAAPPTTAIAPSSISIEVVNGTGVAGQAGGASSALAGLGYSTKVASGSASPVATTVIDYAPDSSAAAAQLQSVVVGGATLTEDSSLTPTPYNLKLVTGRSYGGVKGTASASASTTAPPTTPAPPTLGTTPDSQIDPSSSSYYKGQYIPPGRVPGQTPQTCPS